MTFTFFHKKLPFLLLLFSLNSFAQKDNRPLFKFEEKLLIESKWHYTHTTHAASNTTLYKAQGQYDYFIYFRYDFSYQEFINDRLNEGKWKLKGRTIKYPFKGIDEFQIAELSETTLVLEFKPKNSKENHRYHFNRISDEEAPFPKPDNELPQVLVEADDPNAPSKKKKLGWLSKLFRRNKLKDIYEPEKEPTYISIELVGGGYYGGVNPVLKDFITIKTDGRLIKEIESVQHGLMVTKKYIPREELERFAEYVVGRGFFEMERTYDCTNPTCMKRKKETPKPIPLRLSVAYGDKKKLITLPIWGKDNSNIKYIDYPPAIDHIIEAIQKMANRSGDAVVKK